MKTIKEIDNTKFRIPIAELKIWEENYKDIDRKAVDALKEELVSEGQLSPILVDARSDTQGRIIGGNATYMALTELIAEEKWQYGDMVWIEPIEPESDAHAVKLAFLHNAQYGRINKERMYELSELLVDTDYSLMNIPASKEGIDYTIMDLRDDFGPSDPDPTQEITDKEEKTLTCPNCEYKGKRSNFNA